MEIFLQVLDYMNIIFIALTMLSSAVQVLFMILAFFCKKVTFAESEKKGKICVLIPACNEEKLIDRIITDLKKQNYPTDRYDINVIAHNCTDKTAEIAKNCGANVFECNTKERLKGMALKCAIDEYLPKDYDLFVVFDADCRVDADCIAKMNDAFQSGVHIARGYLGSTNTFDNTVSCVSSLYNARDGRITARVREKLHMSVQLIGAIFMMSADMLRDFGGFPSSTSITEDADLMVKAMVKKYRIHYIEDAIAYTEHTNTAKELFKRNMRLGNGINKIFWCQGYKLLGRFFTTFNPSYLDMFLTLSFLPISLLSCIWFPAYYIFLVLKMIITGEPVLHMCVQMSMQDFIPMAITVLVLMVALLSLQGVATVFLQRDRLLANSKWKDYTKGLLMMCPLMLFTNVAITAGILNPKQKWDQVKRIGSNSATAKSTDNKDNPESDNGYQSDIDKESSKDIAEAAADDADRE